MTDETKFLTLEIAAGLARRLRTTRHAAGLSVDKLVELSGVSRAQIIRWERGEGGGAGLALVAALAKGLGVAAAWLAYGAEPEKPNRS